MKPNEILDELIYLVDSEYCGLKEHKPCMEYLKSLKNIEDELGIDLVTLFKALKNGIHAADGDTWDGNELAVYFKKKCLYSEWYSLEGYSHIECFYFKDYGKTWALTKEELL